MIVIQITHHVKPECVERYMTATLENARATHQEPGNIRFDVLRDIDDPCQFQLYEAYEDREAHQAHLTSAHFVAWRDAVHDVFTDRSIHKLEAVCVPVCVPV